LFGPHLIIDGTRCDKAKLGDRILIEQILDDYPRAIGMTKIGGPYIFEYQAPDPAYSGISGIVIIAESHIAIHTFPALDYFTMDIFSCKKFDPEAAVDYIKKALDCQEMDRTLLQRGLSFRGPHHGPEGATDELIAARQQELHERGMPPEREVAAYVAQREAALLEHWPQYGVTPDYGTYGDQAPRPEAPANSVTAITRPARTSEQVHYQSRNGPGEALCSGNGAGSGNPVYQHMTGELTTQPIHPTPTAPAADSDRAAWHGLELPPPNHRGAIELGIPPTEPIQINPTASISGLLDKMGGIGFQGRNLSRAARVWERMLRDPDCTIFLGLSGAMVPGGMRELLVYLIEHRFIDVLVSTGANLFHDVHETFGRYHYLGSEYVNDVELFEKGLDRMHDIFAAEEEFRHVDNFTGAFSAMQQDIQGKPITTREWFARYGRILKRYGPKKGIVRAAAEHGVPIYVPAIGDSSFGIALAEARNRGQSNIVFDVVGDVLETSRICANAKKTGVIYIGGGTPKNFIQQASVTAAAMENRPIMHTYAVQLTTDAPYWGGLSGCTFNEAQSWGKVAADADMVTCYVDASLALPIIVTALAQRFPGVRKPGIVNWEKPEPVGARA
jgi:deoxyhypusine synthase